MKKNKIQKTISIIGCGKVGTTIGFLLSENGFKVDWLYDVKKSAATKARKMIGDGRVTTDIIKASKASEIVILTTPDDHIQDTCKLIAKNNGFKNNQILFHTSGAYTSEILSASQKTGVITASVHPLMSFVSIEQGIKDFRGVFVTCEGDGAKTCSEIIRKIGANTFIIESDKKSTYHAGAAAASNFVVSAVDLGIELIKSSGVPAEKILTSIMPLLESVVSNIKNVGVPNALTGPISRGDIKTLELHLKSIDKYNKKLLQIYSQLSLYTVEVALKKKSINTKQANTFRKLIKKYQS